MGKLRCGKEEFDSSGGGEPPFGDEWNELDTTAAFKDDPEGPHWWDPPTKPIPAGQAG